MCPSPSSRIILTQRRVQMENLYDICQGPSHLILFLHQCTLVQKSCEVRFQHLFLPSGRFGAQIYWSRAPIHWSPKILFSIFWKGMKRKGYDKTRFCVSHEGLPNGLGTFNSPCLMFENKTRKHIFLTRRGSNIMEPGRQYIGAHQISFPK